MLEVMRGALGRRGPVGRYLHRAVAARIPTTTADPRSRPLLPWWPFGALAVALAVINVPVFGLTLGYGLLALPVALLVAAPVAVARLRPLLGWALALVPVVALLPLHRLLLADAVPPLPWLANQLLAHLPVIYLVAVATPLTVCLPATVITVVAGLAIALQETRLDPPVLVQGAALWTLATVLAVVLGRARLQRRNATIRIAEEQSRLRVLEERARLARDLHDVVAHHLSVISVQATTAPYRLDTGGRAEIAQEFRSIGAAARESLQELRQVLDVLRGTATPRAPGLAELPRLAESARTAGVPVRLVRTGAGTDPGPEVGAVAYRIVQEALSNVIKHAPGAETRVLVDCADRLTVEVVNGPARSRPVPRSDSGHGLAGMRERVAAVGGTIRTGPTPDGGFRVRAELPLPAAEAEAEAEGEADTEAKRSRS
ncbi:MAG TPA: histidine kinase [Microlunatus sp.]|nr:histidine kinase [Microlunatus sp.]